MLERCCFREAILARDCGHSAIGLTYASARSFPPDSSIFLLVVHDVAAPRVVFPDEQEPSRALLE